MRNQLLRSGAAAASLALLLLLATPAFAAWTGDAAGLGATVATVLGAPGTPVAATNGPVVTISWAATILPGAASPEGYVVTRTAQPGGTAVAVGGTCAGSVLNASCSETVAAGDWAYAVSTRHHGWTSASSPTSEVVTVVQPASPSGALSFPVAGATYRTDTWDAGCGTSPGGLCGTAAPGPTGQEITSVTIAISTGDGRYWGGSSFDGGEPVRHSVYAAVPSEETPAGPVAWSYPFASTAFPTDGTYIVEVVVTDTWEATQQVSATFVVDQTLPSASVTAPTSGTSVASGTTVVVTADVADATSGLAAVQFEAKLGAGAWAAVGSVPLGGPYSVSTSFTAGAWELRATAVDGAGNVAVSSTVGLTVRPQVTALTTVALNQDGRLKIGESLTVTFSDPMAPSTFCSTWTGSGDQSLVSGAVRFDLSPSDVLTIAITSPSVCGGTFNLGSVGLGANYNSHSTNVRTFSGSKAGEYSEIRWDATNRRLTLVFGKASGGSEGNVAVGTYTATLTPSAVPTSATGIGLQTVPFSASLPRY